ncbi:unnamed protein product, partial [Rotaria magnacalcarata]
MQQTNCDYPGELYFDEYKNMTGPDAAADIRKNILKQEREQISPNQITSHVANTGSFFA